mmetsp:Transcript_20919/g.69841  ORF Transcript_20919/g.69841 Transcript_20919/m.69841 type:complete len:209 (-) Transcript_20919:449-1075(-)
MSTAAIRGLVSPRNFSGFPACLAIVPDSSSFPSQSNSSALPCTCTASPASCSQPLHISSCSSPPSPSVGRFWILSPTCYGPEPWKHSCPASFQRTIEIFPRAPETEQSCWRCSSALSPSCWRFFAVSFPAVLLACLLGCCAISKCHDRTRRWRKVFAAPSCCLRAGPVERVSTPPRRHPSGICKHAVTYMSVQTAPGREDVYLEDVGD